ncbi:endonuclease/exonuclease/phosphatase family protein [Polymorphum gilvum]|uniref:Endonuclease/exonuclease/phosphatase family n=1 Tax=Polymorphum gilvum (strain LMG 25793 / CGMCC 1.9160 / SL003B-26A1) TaxID=991905 RepID=F2J070_POLGS|nr:endonuclease/exonuclease/phosphatase family protein [Polymorphum gilvum]ADZ68605.1 Endonuclease/exonuclease/phosphatase family [Polymorphum gilvum SL003B-26A1]
MRLATFNLESFGEDDFDAEALQPRLDALRPTLLALKADVLCLQEVNAQRLERKGTRVFAALDALVAGTPYEDFFRATSLRPDGTAPADKHNLAVLSRFPVVSSRTIREDHVEPPLWRPRSADPLPAGPEPVGFDRPLLHAALDVGLPRPLHVFCVHLRAPIAAPVAGGKLSAVSWGSTAAWAEGYFLASMKRVGQALELRLAIDALFDADPEALIAAAGDFNAVGLESPLRLVMADPDDTGNPALGHRRLRQLDAAVPEERRQTVVHRGRGHALDHILVSRELLFRARDIRVLNEGLADEVRDAGTPAEAGSFHAPVVATFEL